VLDRYGDRPPPGYTPQGVGKTTHERIHAGLIGGTDESDPKVHLANPADVIGCADDAGKRLSRILQ
jgi:hypothetical protein